MLTTCIPSHLTCALWCWLRALGLLCWLALGLKQRRRELAFGGAGKRIRRMRKVQFVVVMFCSPTPLYPQTTALFRLLELYLSAIKKAMVSGYHYLFTQLYMDKSSLVQVVGTCGAPAWYRKYLLGYENMLRSLDPTFRDVTLPYWDLFEDSANRISTSTSCNGIEGCSPILKDFGGCQGPAIVSGKYVVNGEQIPSGNCVNTSIAAYACASLEKCEHCLPRGDWDIGDSTLEFGPTTFADLIRHAKGMKSSSTTINTSAMNTLRKGIENSVQLTLHSLLGGVYETRAAAFDPIFISHYATLDMMYQFVQSCNQSVALTGTCKGNGALPIAPDKTIPMKIDDTPVEAHADLGVFFQDVGTTFKTMDAFAVEYELSAFLQHLLETFSLQCNPDTSAPGAITYDTTKRMSDEAVAIHTFVTDLAACDRTSEVIGTTTDTSSTFISCELLSSLMNGAFTNFSTPVRTFFGATQEDLPKCVGALAAVTSVEVTVKPSASCHMAMLKDTSINTKTDFNSLSRGFAIVTRGTQDGQVQYMNPVK
ncbi:hypothetical protein PsorP6_006583 [Peronosclerospora sorghi]|uniref:Uncharacterized protein n=1 Tax=Peronosclerospora sorghi TaxID=230839 RepID=A0ACC0W512_9STRA|nr:hypothetical protein PsorP6_006583 [Peronosclerospora sorghi]